MAPKVKVITGPPCSGKTSYVQQRIGPKDMCYDFDRIADAVSFGGAHNLQREHLQGLLLDYRDTTIRRLERGRMKDVENVWIIATTPTEDMKGRLDALGAEYIPMETTKEECLRRLQQDDSRQDKDAWQQNIEQYFETAHSGRKTEVSMNEEKDVEQLDEPAAGTEPAKTSGAGKRLFTQEEVNNFVSKRVNKLNAELDALREQLAAQSPVTAEPPPPTEAELLQQKLESQMKALDKDRRRFDMEKELAAMRRPRELLDIFDIDDPKFYDKCNTVMYLINQARGPAPGYDPTNGRAGAEGTAAFLTDIFGDKSGHKPKYGPDWGRGSRWD